MIKLTTEIWVKALIRRCAQAAVPAVVVKKGFAQSGTVLLKVNTLDGSAQVYSPMTGADGERQWILPLGGGPAEEKTVDAYIERQIKRDSDLWVVEVEDRQGRHFLQEPVEGERGA